MDTTLVLRPREMNTNKLTNEKNNVAAAITPRVKYLIKHFVTHSYLKLAAEGMQNTIWNMGVDTPGFNTHRRLEKFWSCTL